MSKTEGEGGDTYSMLYPMETVWSCIQIAIKAEAAINSRNIPRLQICQVLHITALQPEAKAG